MDAARAAVHKITSRKGHTTDVDEYVNPAVVSETIKPHRHEETTEAIDREVHQDHYHTTVQPIAHREVLPEKHVQNVVPQVEREFRNDNEHETKRRVEAELQQFRDTQTVHQTTHTTAAAAAVVGEHVHHHVHETVQPVIHKETVQPEVVHTVVPIHEVHHGGAQHHGLSALPMKTLDEFTKAGGIIGGSKSHTHEEYEGAPRPYNEKLTTTLEKVLPGHHGTHGTTGSGLTGSHGTSGSGLTGTHGTHGTGSGLTGGRDRDEYGSSGSGLTGTHGTHGTGSGLTGGRDRDEYGSSGSGLTGNRGQEKFGVMGDRDRDQYGSSGIGSGHSSHNTGKPSMADKMNPKIDSDRDGKAGIMD